MNRTSAALALTLVLGGGVALTAAPVHAATCATLGHAYFIYPVSGFNYMSGFENDQRYGVATITARRGDGFELGGNGIDPLSRITFRAASSGGMFAGSNRADSSLARSNCVVNQTSNRYTIGNVPNGTYTITAEYTGGNTGKFVFGEPVVKVKIVG
ncbi:hypothetical protein ACIBG8_22900 [Nonomuraea sp. NPDC050556]|uniref:hypothetical protein n=1 Tax=Nonomuraea sp. NPDC050556 TaxID=3364369 RepID=UPI00379494F9